MAPDCIIDPALLFQYFVVVSRSGDLSLDEVLSYELSPFPPALFRLGTFFEKRTNLNLLRQFEIMLQTYHVTPTSSQKNTKYNINLLKETLGDDVCHELLFIHAYLGCDSTSRIFGIGKKSAFQKLVKSDPVIKSCAIVHSFFKINLRRRYQNWAKT